MMAHPVAVAADVDNVAVMEQPVHEPLRAQDVEDLVLFLLTQSPGGSRAGLLMPGHGPQATVERGSTDTERIARGLDPYLARQLCGCLHEFVPSSRLNPSSPATFPCTSMIRCALWSSFSRRATSRSSLCTLPCSGLRSIALRPRFFDRPCRDPLRDALRHVVRCDEYRPSRRSKSTDLAGLRAPVSFLYDPLLVRRSEPPARRFVYHLRVRRGCRASLTLHRRRGGCTILFHSLSQSQHPRFLCLRPTLILQGFRVSCTLAERVSSSSSHSAPRGPLYRTTECDIFVRHF